ncbi:serine/threonine-protein kinase [Actinomadura oligospora]|uniref:serine/threonine-protein kinase n=1 Tax=Actinomadura oligospora TaxID=111804 RepID=UPI0004AF189F|nr:serine/threonine-protein kinase [Actinomadura oligospora]
MTQWRVAGFDEVRELGRGRHGRTVLARHGTSGSTVVVRYLEPSTSGAARERFRQKAGALGQLRDPRVARPYRLVENAHGTAVIMERVDGVGLRDVLRRERRTTPEAGLVLLRDALLGLAAAHAAGVVHGDCTPGDVLVRDGGRAVLVDFGVADHAGTSSPLYRAPELWHGAEPSPASDVYAVTCVFFEAVAGHRPYGDPEAGHLGAPVPEEDVPEPLRPLVASGMAKDPRVRPSDAAHFADEAEKVGFIVFGADWEARGRRALADLAAPDRFPPAGPPRASSGRRRRRPAPGRASGRRRPRGRALAAAGIAVAAVLAAGGYGTYQAVGRDAPSRTAAAEHDATAGKALPLGRLQMRVPASWEAFPITVRGRAADSFYVTRAGGCPTGGTWRPSASSLGSCPGFAVMGPSFFDRSESSAYGGGPYDPKDTFGSKVAMSCPRHPDLVAGGSGKGASQTGFKGIELGGRAAEYHQWRVPCFEREGDGTGSVYTERIWYAPSAQIVVVDAWNTPDLDTLLQRATWP